jgi:hypothetical protein
MMMGWDDPNESVTLERIMVQGTVLKPGDHIRLRPKHHADALDLILNGKMATIEAIEQDFENRIFLAVTIDDDPGQDFGLMRQPGHRFFYTPDEIEVPLPGNDTDQGAA